MLTLYFSPAAISFAVHVALEEAGIPFDVHEVSIRDGRQLAPEYLAIHPLGRVPALRLASGAVLTETPAILGFIADSVPDRGLMPADPWSRARATEWLSLFVSALHPAFIGFFRPQRFGDSPELHEPLRRDSRARFFQLLQHVEKRLPEGPFVLGERFSLCDPYASMFFLWARVFEFPVDALPRYGALYERVSARPAFRRAFAREGLDRILAARREAPRPKPSAPA